MRHPAYNGGPLYVVLGLSPEAWGFCPIPPESTIPVAFVDAAVRGQDASSIHTTIKHKKNYYDLSPEKQRCYDLVRERLQDQLRGGAITDGNGLGKVLDPHLRADNTFLGIW